jgi:hypothetical protein
MSSYKKITAGALVLAACVIMTCSSASLRAVWKDPSFKGGPFKKIVVIGAFKSLETRDSVEKTMVGMIKDRGGDAVPGLSIMAPDIKYQYNEMELLFQKNGIDGILIINLAGIRKKEKFIPGGEALDPEIVQMTYFDYFAVYRERLEPGRIQETDIVTIQAKLYQNDNDHLVWNAEMRLVESYQSEDGLTDPSREARVLGALITDNLVGAGLIARPAR